jgi:hypothetical protein
MVYYKYVAPLELRELRLGKRTKGAEGTERLISWKLGQGLFKRVFIDGTIQDSDGEAALFYECYFGRTIGGLDWFQTAQNEGAVAGNLDIKSVAGFG